MISYDARGIESRWSSAWERDGCYRAPDHPDGEKFFNYDSGPFPSGPLHMGHVRTYLLGDVTARYQRSLGKSVLYTTEWDAFGLPNELEATRQGMSPAAFTQRWIGIMSRQMRTLGISYDWSRVRATCDPAYYGWTQWLFLKLLRLGHISQREAELPYCPDCQTVLSRMQVEGTRCWRCATEVKTRRLRQWFVSISPHAGDLLRSMENLPGWSTQIKSLVRGAVHAHQGRASAESDWLISRQRSWGTPIPVVHCKRCGMVPVPEEDLPVRLPEDLDWSLGPRALSSHRSFPRTHCPRCRKGARRETDTLDCFFDDIWCFLACLVKLDSPPWFRGERVEKWMPVDRFHSGFDTVAYLHLHRYLAKVLHDSGDFPFKEPIAGHMGNEMVLRDGHKMSKHLGNTVSPSAVIRKHGADTLRVAMLWAAGPHTAVDWRPQLLDRAESLLGSFHRLYTLAASAGVAPGPPASPSKSILALQRKAGRSLAAIARFVDEYRPNAGIEELASLFRHIEAFALCRLESARLLPGDAGLLRQILDDECVVLALFAPHLAEELWHRMGNSGYVVQQRWPRIQEAAGVTPLAAA